MARGRVALGFAFLLALSASLIAADPGKTVDLFNGQNLDDWIVDGGKWTVGKAEVSPTDPKLLVAKPGTGEMITAGGSTRGGSRGINRWPETMTTGTAPVSTGAGAMIGTDAATGGDNPHHA